MGLRTAVASLCLALSAAACSTQPTASDALTGGWVSKACEPAGPSRSVTRSFVLDRHAWRVTATVFGDGACTQPQYVVLNAGRYELGDPVAEMPGARAAFFGFTDKQVTPLTGAGVEALNAASCGGRQTWTVGVPGGVGAGCTAPGTPALAECAGEFDLVSLSATSLFLGRRPAAGSDLCAEQRRPTALGAELVRS